MAEEAQQTIQKLNELLGDRMPFKLRLVDPHDLNLLDKNARYMAQDMFQNLVANIKRDGGLTSLPLCYQEEDGTLRVLSGNHRVQAAVHAGLEEVLVLIIDSKKSRSEQVAIQLSHNSISGKDDMVVLKSLWEEIEEIDLKLYAGLDSETIDELDKLEFEGFSDASPDFKQMVLLFLPEEEAQLRTIIEDVDMFFSGDANYVTSVSHYQKAFDLLVDIKEQYEIVNNPTAFMKLCELARERLESIN